MQPCRFVQVLSLIPVCGYSSLFNLACCLLDTQACLNSLDFFVFVWYFSSISPCEANKRGYFLIFL